MTAAACALLAAAPGATATTTAPARAAATAPTQPATACPALLNHRFNRLQDEAPQSLCQYAGRVLLVVNTASYCGYTPQYEGLEALYARYQARGLVVLGFPSNDFGAQEPGQRQQIADLCFNTYGVRFPMFSKTVVSGTRRHALFAELARASGQAPQWNFHKYLVDRQGRVLASFPSAVEPLDIRLRSAIERAL